MTNVDLETRQNTISWAVVTNPCLTSNVFHLNVPEITAWMSKGTPQLWINVITYPYHKLSAGLANLGVCIRVTYTLKPVGVLIPQLHFQIAAAFEITAAVWNHSCDNSTAAFTECDFYLSWSTYCSCEVLKLAASRFFKQKLPMCNRGFKFMVYIKRNCRSIFICLKLVIKCHYLLA